MGNKLSDVRNALIATINANVSDPLSSYERVQDVVELPAIMVLPLQTDYDADFGEGTLEEIYLYVLCQRVDTDLGQQHLDDYIANFGSNSIPQAVNQHATLGLQNCTANVYAMHGYGGSFVVAGIPHVGAILKCRVVLDP